MKKYKFLFQSLVAATLVLSIGGCDESANKQNQQGSTNQETATQAPDRSPYVGNWINLEYVKALRSTRSPREAQDKARLLLLEDESVSGIVNFHEGEALEWGEKEGMVGLMADGKFEALKLDGNVLRYNGTEFQMAAMNGDRPLVVEQSLLAGNYRFNDQEVQLSPTGGVTGLVGIHHYQVVYDYYGPGRDRDMVQMGPDANNLRDFIFGYENDALVIFEINCLAEEGGECLEIEPGTPLFILSPAGAPLTE